MNDFGFPRAAKQPFGEPYGARQGSLGAKPRGVFVLGMHRSGTSAATGVIHRLGLPIGDRKDLMGADEGNIRGYFELIPLMQENNLVLQTLGVNWACPPRLKDDWHLDPTIDALKARSREVFQRTLSTSQWVWKDPRTCVTFGYWSDLLDCHQIAVIVVRNPLEVADSMAVAHGSTRRHSLALWERYMRSAVQSARGKPTLVCSYDDLISSPVSWVERLRSFLLVSGFTIEEDDPAKAAADSVDPGLWRKRKPQAPGKTGEAGSELCELHEFLTANKGVHFPWDASPPGEESESTEIILAEHANFASTYMTRFEAEKLILVHERLKESFRRMCLEWEREREDLLQAAASPSSSLVRIVY